MKIDSQLSAAIAKATGRSRLATLIAAIGASHMIWFALGAAYATTWYAPGADPGAGRTYQLIVFLATAWVLTLILEFLFRRRRPFELGPKPLIEMLLKTPSFPSGHATISFALASAMYFADAALFPWYLAAAIYISFSRVAVGVHYLSDVIAGAIVGTLVPWGLVYFAFYLLH
jgi:membrane-associated phospholipid phosphatase